LQHLVDVGIFWRVARALRVEPYNVPRAVELLNNASAFRSSNISDHLIKIEGIPLMMHWLLDDRMTCKILEFIQNILIVGDSDAIDKDDGKDELAAGIGRRALPGEMEQEALLGHVLYSVNANGNKYTREILEGGTGTGGTDGLAKLASCITQSNNPAIVDLGRGILMQWFGVDVTTEGNFFAV